MKKLLTLTNEIWVPAPLDEVWNFGSHPKNLAEISPPKMKVKIHYSKTESPQNGDTVIIETQPVPLGPKIKWYSKIDEVVSSGDFRQFVDIQEKGPFKYWKHTHKFWSAPNGQRKDGTMVSDFVEYALPLGALGSLAHFLFVRSELETMFAYRNAEFKKRFPL